MHSALTFNMATTSSSIHSKTEIKINDVAWQYVAHISKKKIVTFPYMRSHPKIRS